MIIINIDFQCFLPPSSKSVSQGSPSPLCYSETQLCCWKFFFFQEFSEFQLLEDSLLIFGGHSRALYRPGEEENS